MRWNFIHHWKTCLVTRTSSAVASGGAGTETGSTATTTDASGAVKMRIKDRYETGHSNGNGNGCEHKIQNTNRGYASASAYPISESSDETDTDLITVSITNDTLKRWSVGSATNSEGEYSKVVVQFGSELDDYSTNSCSCEWDRDRDADADTLKDEPFQLLQQTFCNGTTKMDVENMAVDVDIERTPEIELRVLKRSNGVVSFIIPMSEPEESEPVSHPVSNTKPNFNVKSSPTNASLIVTAATVQNLDSPPNAAQLGQIERWRKLFDRFDLEGFGEIPWDYFYYIALRSPYFINEIEPGKLEMLRDLAKDKLEQLQVKVKSKSQTSLMCTAITFQYFLNLMSGKRSRSFKCAVHHRDREVSSENDFQILTVAAEPRGAKSPAPCSSTSPPFNLRQRFASCLASEFLTDDRDRKYYTHQYTCCPPPIFITLLTLLQIGFFAYYVVYHATWPDEELQLYHDDEVVGAGSSWTGCLTFSFSAAYYKPTPIASNFIYRPDRKLQPWRFLFYALLHASWPHFVFSVVTQLLIGLPLEMVHGTGRIFFVYIVAVIGSALSVSVLDPQANLVGGAGGAYALLVAHCANVLLYSDKRKESCCTRFLRAFRVLLLLFAASVDVGIAVYNRYIVILAPGPSALDFQVVRVRPYSFGARAYEEIAVLRQELAPISYLAHITGAVLGLNVGLVVLRNFQQSLRQQLIWWFTLCGCGAWILGTILINVLGVDFGLKSSNTFY